MKEDNFIKESTEAFKSIVKKHCSENSGQALIVLAYDRYVEGNNSFMGAQGDAQCLMNVLYNMIKDNSEMRDLMHIVLRKRATEMAESRFDKTIN